MAILQALLGFIRGSAGKVINAIFGWAVLALFGQTSKTEQTLLSGVVGAAAVWPLLALGVVFPKLVLFSVAFVPLIGRAPSLWLRVLWIALALAVPVLVGSVVAARSPPDRLPEPGWKKLLRGFPITLALASAFFLQLVISPCQRIMLALHGEELVHVPVLAPRGVPQRIARAMDQGLRGQGIGVAFADAPWTMTAPSRVLHKLGGRAFRSLVSERIEYLRGEGFAIAQTGNEMQIRGKKPLVARAHALAAEVLGPEDVLQTFDPQAQALEKQIKRVWAVFRENPSAHQRAPALRRREREISAELQAAPLEFEEFQVVYRELLQLDRALRGERALLAPQKPRSKEESMMEEKKPATAQPAAPVPLSLAPGAVERLSTRELIAHVLQSATLLGKKEVELARAELKGDIKDEVTMAKGLGVAGLCALFTVNLLLVAVAVALSALMPLWASTLLVAAVVLAVGTVAGLFGWGKRVKDPLAATRRTLKEDMQWAKERIA